MRALAAGARPRARPAATAAATAPVARRVAPATMMAVAAVKPMAVVKGAEGLGSAGCLGPGALLEGATCAAGYVVGMIRHRVKKHRLNRPSDQRKALVRGLTTHLLRNGRIKTTRAKAKAIVKSTHHMITLSKAARACEKESDALHKKRQAFAFIYDEELVNDIFEEAPDRYEDRPGGYTRIIPTLNRKGDNADMVYIELV